MITHHTNINLEGIEYTTVKTNKKIEYLNIPCGFDIETTSTEYQDTKVAFMYVWQIGIGHDRPVYYGRTWEEFINVCSTLQQHFNLHAERRLVVYVHNLGYEFQFMRKLFTWLDVFAVGERKPIRATCDYGIEFRDSYILSGFSLESTARNLTKHKVVKLVGDLDYSLIRHHQTPLTTAELAYCENDIRIITAYIQEQLDIYENMARIPMTNTGRVRSYVRNECYYTSTNHRKTSKGKFNRYRKIMNDLTLTVPIYARMKQTFIGGFTHANANYVGEVLNDVTSIDFTSSYPAVMLSEKFPMSRFKEVRPKTETEFMRLRQNRAVVCTIKFHNLRTKITQECYISQSKCLELTDPVINNGRVMSATTLTMMVTEVDLDIIDQVYAYDNYDLSDVYVAHKSYLPKSIIQAVLNLYQDKTELKDVEGSEVEYLLSKGMLNSVYGMGVTDIVKDKSVYSDFGTWGVEPVDPEEIIQIYNESKGRFLYYPWGVYITAYARRNLWTGILAVGDDYVYSDTDSLKLLNYEKHKPYVEWYNQTNLDKLNAMMDYYKLDKKLLSPKTKEGVVKVLGEWDYEDTYERFKTLGAKRYMVQDKRGVHITVAGLSKQNGISYMMEQCDNDVEAVFDMFNDDLYIPAERTGKMTHTYVDEEYDLNITDYEGNTTKVVTPSAVHLESCDFTLNISRQFNNFLHELSRGYLYRGLNQI